MADRIFDNSYDKQIHDTLELVYDALKYKGYDPYGQLTGYIQSQDNTYITTYNNARTLISKLDPEDIIMYLLKSEFKK